MSQMIANVLEIQNCDSLHIVKFNFYGEVLSMMSLELSQKVKVGVEVKLLVKPTHIAIAKEVSGDFSYANRLDCKIIEIEDGELLSSVKLSVFDTILESIIMRSSSRDMGLKVGDSVTAFIDASELSIGEIIDD